MNADAVRWLDLYVGLPLCWLLTVLRYLGRLLTRWRNPPPPRRILVIKLSEMGSTVLAWPALRALKDRLPEAQLFFLVFSNNRAILPPLDIIPPENIIAIDFRSIGAMIRSGLSALLRLWRARIDTTVDMDFFSRLTAAFAFLICRGNRVGFHRYTDEGHGRGDLITHRVLYSPHVHTSVAFMALVLRLFTVPDREPCYRGHIDPAKLPLPRHTPPESDLRAVHDRLEALGVPMAKRPTLILINPNSSDLFPLRRWPLDHYAGLCARLLEALPDAWLVITGVASERADARYILERLEHGRWNERCIDFTGQTSFAELLALYALARLMVTNDSGPAHFATLLELPTVVLFGPETPRLYSPLGDRHVDLYAGFACSPCVSVYNAKKSPCGESRCLRAITVEEVLREALRQLEPRNQATNFPPIRDQAPGHPPSSPEPAGEPP